MPRLFSVASWNVEHFRDSPNKTRIQGVAKFIEDQGGQLGKVPEIFAIYEVEGKHVYREFMQRFPDHRFHLTEGAQLQEIFVGVHKRLPSFATQRLEFKTGRRSLRPGLILSVQVNGTNYTLLFLHLKSGPNPEDFGLRDKAFTHSFNLKKALDGIAPGGQSNYIFLGDLNTMGIDDTAPYSKVVDLDADEEIERLKKWCTRRDMLLLDKDVPASWWNGSQHYDPSNLDHVVVSKHMDIRRPNGSEGVAVYGWPKLPQGQVKKWLTDFSDHGLLLFEVWG